MRKVASVLAACLILTACSAGSEEATATPPTTASSPASTPAATGTTAGTSAPAASSTSTTTPAPTTTAGPTAPAQLEVMATAFGEVGEIDVAVTGTRRPRFEWAAVADAARYYAFVVDDQGATLWAWGGESTAVTVGSGDVDREGIGAFIAGPAWLQVLGVDGSGIVLAVSSPVPVG